MDDKYSISDIINNSEIFFSIHCEDKFLRHASFGMLEKYIGKNLIINTIDILFLIVIKTLLLKFGMQDFIKSDPCSSE